MKLLSQILFLTLVPLLIVLSYNYYQNIKLEEILNEQIDQRLVTISKNIKKELHNKKVISQKTAQLLSSSQLIKEAIEKRDIDFLYNRANKYRQSQIITETVFIDKKGVVLSRASDEFHFNDSIKDTDLNFLMENKNQITQPKIVFFDKKFQLISIEPVYKYDVNLIGYVLTSHIIDKNFLNSLSTDHLYMEFQKEGIFINNFDEIIEDSFKSFTKISINKHFSFFINIKTTQNEILRQKMKQNYIIVFLLILSSLFIFYFVGRVLKPFNTLNKLLLEFSSQNIQLTELINQIKGNKNRFNELSEIQNSIVLTLEKLNATQKELVKSNNETLNANRLKNKFLSDMSHQIRTPMNEIISFLQLLEKTDLSSKQKKFLLKSLQATETLSDVINNILDIAKIESGELELNIHPTSLEKVMKECNKRYKNITSNKNIDFIIRMDDDLNAYQLYIDQLRFTQALLNIIDNAVKFTYSGLVKVEVDIENKNKKTLDLIIKVHDTGIGIKKSNLEIIFNSFITFNDEKNNSIQRGSGLGLSISKQIVTLMGGTIKVASKIEEGTVFTIKLPNIKYK